MMVMDYVRVLLFSAHLFCCGFRDVFSSAVGCFITLIASRYIKVSLLTDIATGGSVLSNKMLQWISLFFLVCTLFLSSVASFIIFRPKQCLNGCWHLQVGSYSSDRETLSLLLIISALPYINHTTQDPLLLHFPHSKRHKRPLSLAFFPTSL